MKSVSGRSKWQENSLRLAGIRTLYRCLNNHRNDNCWKMCLSTDKWMIWRDMLGIPIFHHIRRIWRFLVNSRVLDSFLFPSLEVHSVFDLRIYTQDRCNNEIESTKKKTQWYDRTSKLIWYYKVFRVFFFVVVRFCKGGVDGSRLMFETEADCNVAIYKQSKESTVRSVSIFECGCVRLCTYAYSISLPHVKYKRYSNLIKFHHGPPSDPILTISTPAPLSMFGQTRNTPTLEKNTFFVWYVCSRHGIPRWKWIVNVTLVVRGATNESTII